MPTPTTLLPFQPATMLIPSPLLPTQTGHGRPPVDRILSIDAGERYDQLLGCCILKNNRFKPGSIIEHTSKKPLLKSYCQQPHFKRKEKNINLSPFKM